MLRRWARSRLDAGSIHLAACKQLQLSNAEPPVEELSFLIAALDRSVLSFTGAIALYEILIGATKNNLSLRLAQSKAAHQQVIDSPIFIAGFPRTGTTLLHNLIAQDENRQAPFMWELHEPALSHSPKDIASQRKSVQRFAKANLYLCPELNDIHPIDADAIEECLKFLENTFFSPTFLMYNHAPDYQQWLLAQLGSDKAQQAYYAHRLQLQFLQLNHQRNKKWVLKSPVHALMMEGLTTAYPNALVINTHRDPCEAIPSFCSLVRVIRSMMSEDVDMYKVGQLGLTYLDHCLAVSERVAEQRKVAMVDVSYQVLVQQPCESVELIYAELGLAVSPLMRDKMEQWLAASTEKRQHGSAHRYTLDDYGLSETLVRQRYENYYRYLEKLNTNNGVLKRI